MKQCSGELSSMYLSIIMMAFKQACYTATRLENISLFIADSDRSNLKESRNICCSACLQEHEGSRAEAAQTLRGVAVMLDPSQGGTTAAHVGVFGSLEGETIAETMKMATKLNLPQVSMPPLLPPPSSSPPSFLPSSSLYRGWRSFALPSLFLAEVVVAPVIFLKIIMAFTKPFFPSGTVPRFPGPSPLLPVSWPSPPSPPLAPFSRQQSLVVK